MFPEINSLEEAIGIGAGMEKAVSAFIAIAQFYHK